MLVSFEIRRVFPVWMQIMKLARGSHTAGRLAPRPDAPPQLDTHFEDNPDDRNVRVRIYFLD
jgi:hypothetical protein